MMNMRDFLNGLEGKVEGEFEEKRVELLAGLDAKKEKRKNTPTKTQKANEPIAAAIVEYLEGEGKAVLGTEIAKALNLSTQKLGGIARNLVGAGVLVKEKQKVKGKGEQIAYAIAPVDAEGEAEVEEVVEGEDE